MVFHILVAGGEPYLCLFHTFGKVVPHSWHNRSHYLGTTVSKAWHNFAKGVAQSFRRHVTGRMTTGKRNQRRRSEYRMYRELLSFNKLTVKGDFFYCRLIIKPYCHEVSCLFSHKLAHCGHLIQSNFILHFLSISNISLKKNN